VAQTAEVLAGVVGVSPEELAAATTRNFQKLFGMASAA
jgi:Tat protein secretion system quality control protein TatD with DNase activity